MKDQADLGLPLASLRSGHSAARCYLLRCVGSRWSGRSALRGLRPLGLPPSAALLQPLSLRAFGPLGWIYGPAACNPQPDEGPINPHFIIPYFTA